MPKWLICLLRGHLWETHQHGFVIDTGRSDVIIAWKQCRRCAASRLIHILR